MCVYVVVCSLRKLWQHQGHGSLAAEGALHCACSGLVASLEILRDVCATKHICRVCHTLSAELLRLEDAVGADVLWLEVGMWWFL